MIINMSYWTRVLKNLLYVIFILIGLYVALKLSIFYMPFLVAFVISLMIEPVIKKIMKKTGLTRRTSSIIIFILVSIIIIGGLTWLLITLFAESSNLLQSLNDYIDKLYSQFQNLINYFNFDNIHLSSEILNIIQNSTENFLTTASTWLRNILNNLLNFITSIPSIAICIGITVIALYFICVDKIYILDQIEHHLPKLWVKKISIHLKELIQTLGGYLKAEATLILVSFIISLIGLYILQIVRFNIQYPLLIALFIGFVDALPILRFRYSNDTMGNYLCIQILEPKLVSKNIGVHPIFTLIAMYTGFKIIGVIGLLVGPIVLIIFKNIFANLIDKGVFKTIFDKK